jgi:hypothetical protein
VPRKRCLRVRFSNDDGDKPPASEPTNAKKRFDAMLEQLQNTGMTPGKAKETL